MMKKMKIILTASTLAAVLCCQGVGADMLNDVMCGTFGIWGQATYLKSTHGGQIYAQQTLSGQGPLISPNGPIRSRSVCPKYEWGFEVGGLYLTKSQCSYAKIFGGWTEFTDTSRIAGFIKPVLPFNDTLQTTLDGETLGSGFGSLKTEYWYIDARAGHFLMRGCGSNVHAYLGIRHVNLCERMTVAFSGLSGSLIFSLYQDIRQRQRSEFNGTGPHLGLGGQFCVWGDFGISGEFGAMALIGTRKNRARSSQVIQALAALANEFQYDNCVAVIPGLDMSAGVNWTMEYCKFKGSVEIGYKLAHYYNAFKTAISRDNNVVLRDVGFAGPYLSLGLTY